VGVNHFTDEGDVSPEVFPIDLERQAMQMARVRGLKERRDNNAVRAGLEDLARAARGSTNLLYPMKIALARLATLGEVADVLRQEFGEYHPH
jgi:methylmalonyl-CoA mutase N-terminal domain/subunit